MSDFDDRWQRLIASARQAPDLPPMPVPDARRVLDELQRRQRRPQWRWTPLRLALAAALALACYLPALHYADRAVDALPQIAAWRMPALPEPPTLVLPAAPALPPPPHLPDPEPLLAKLLPTELRFQENTP